MTNYNETLFNPMVYEINLEKPHATIKRYNNEEDLINNNLVEKIFNDDWHGIYFEDIKDIYNIEYFFNIDISKENKIEVPLSIQLQGYGKPKYINTQYPFDGYMDYGMGKEIPLKNPCMAYLKDFDFEIKENKKVILNFKGFETALFLYINNKFVGYSENLYLDSEFDISSYLKNGTNRICALVFYYSSSSYLLSQDFYRFSGIFRDVTLSEIDKNSVFDFEVKSIYDYKNESGYLKVTLKGDIKECCKEFLLVDKNNKEIFKISTNNNFIEHDLDKVCPYSEENPYLYTLYIRIYKDNSLVEIIKQVVGFKEVHIEGNKIIYNGKRLAIRGVNRHEWNYKRGRNVTLEDTLFDVKFLKEHNVNAVRTSHYPNISYFYDLADEYGLYILDEACLETHGSLGSVHNKFDLNEHIPGNKLEWLNVCLSRTINMYERDKNHPSIFCFSLGNESGAGDAFITNANELKKRNKDIIIHYEGVVGWHNNYEASDLYSRMYAKPEEILEYEKNNSTKPFILCEFSHSMGNSTGNFDEYMNLFKTCESYTGGFIWDFIDQGLLVENQTNNKTLSYGGDQLEKPNDEDFCCNGIIFADRKDAYKSSKAENVKYDYSPIQISFDKDEVTIENLNLFTSTEQYEFIFETHINGRLINKKNLDVKLKPLSKGTKKLSFAGKYNENDLVLYRIVVRKDDRIIYQKETIIQEGKIESNYNSRKFMVHDGFFNIGVEGDNYIYYFSLGRYSSRLPGLIGIEINGEQYIKKDIVPTLFRPTTSNDFGNKFNFINNKLLGYSKFLSCEYDDITIDKTHLEEYFLISFNYYLDRKVNEFINVTYKIDRTGKLNVNVSMKALKSVDEIALFGLRFMLPFNKNKITYFGLGPKENYVDRKASAMLNVYNSTSYDEYVNYIYPQECGNHLDTRYLIINGDNSGLKIYKNEKNFAFKFLPYSEFEIENATHFEELPQCSYNYLTILGFTRGVGGDDSWGAPVHEDYTLNANTNYEFDFYIEPYII